MVYVETTGHVVVVGRLPRPHTTAHERGRSRGIDLTSSDTLFHDLVLLEGPHRHTVTVLGMGLLGRRHGSTVVCVDVLVSSVTDVHVLHVGRRVAQVSVETLVQWTVRSGRSVSRLFSVV